MLSHMKPQVYLGLSVFCFFTTVQAGIPLWKFTPDVNFPPQVSLGPSARTTVKYTITNQSKRTHILIMKPITGINQVTLDEGECDNPFKLGYQQSCILNLQVDGGKLKGNVLGGPVVCNQGNDLQCYQPGMPDSLQITKEAVTKFFVNGSKLINGDGSSWGKAFNNLDSALQAAAATPDFDEIWVATGVYKPSRIYAPQGVIGGAYGINTPKLKTFSLPGNTSIYGGFSGIETSREQRNGQLYPTILCGDMNSNCLTPYVPGNSAGRVWHVLMAGSDVSPGSGAENVTLDSLIVRGGYADGPDSGTLGLNNKLETLEYEHAAGGGLLARYGSTIQLRSMNFDQNTSDGLNATIAEVLAGTFLVLASGGGAVAAIDPHTSIIISNSSFISNTATFPGGSGGALESLLDASYTISSSQFEHNISFRNGGAIRGKGAGDISISSSYFNDNVLNGISPDASGGAIGVINTSLTVLNSTFTQNVSTPTGFGGGAIFFHTPFDNGSPYFLKVDHSKFVNNVASAFGGGGINIFGVIPNSGTGANISNSEFTENTGGVGGAIYISSIPTQISGSFFSENKAELEGGAIFVSNFGNAVFNSLIRSRAQILNSTFISNTVEGVPGSGTSPEFFFNFIANFFSGGSSTVTSIPPGGGAIAVEFSGDAQIIGNIFTGNTALKKPLTPDNRGGAILIGGTTGTPQQMDLARACVSSNSFTNNQADIDDDIALYNPANIIGGVTVDVCVSPLNTKDKKTQLTP